MTIPGPTADLRDQLHAVLGNTYDIERELGGGGMSRVFVARERELDRRVVIKVLPPELAQGVNFERFRRETQLAASLQHPHIVPLLTAGSENGLLYYIMPFVEGESLRARLDRERRLPVTMAIHILREVADALAAAHRRGVVHRDIKPGNVLLAEGHALVTDFGVAKSLGGEDRSGLTTAGLAIGTPAYMSPEQAAADPETDHRADIYALGVLGYELLAGHPPFHSLPPAQVLAAHLATPPEPLARYRPDVPPALADAIARCLAKKPGDRFQSAEELRRHLEVLSTPAQGTSAHLAPVSTRGLGGSIQRLGVPTALAGYALGAVGITWLLRRVIVLAGLPDWVFPAGVGLLVIDFLVLVLAALGQIPWLTRRGAVVSGIMAFAMLGLSAGGWVALKAAGIGPMGSLVAAGKLGARDRILIADFRDRTADPVLGELVTEAFRTDLTQSPVVQVVQSAAIQGALSRMQRTDTTLDLTVARQVAVREGIKAIVTGEITSVGPGIVLSARLVASESGDVLAAFRETAPDSSEVIPAIDRLSKKMRERIGESLRTIRSDGPLADVTTPSLEALRKYTAALRAADRDHDYAKAIPLLEEAIRLDSTFAMAYRKLGITLSNTGQDPRRSVDALRRAYRFRHRLPERERLLAEATYYMRAVNQPDSAVASYEALLAIDPGNFVALNNLGLLYMERGDYVGAEQLYRRALDLDSTAVNRYGLIMDAQVARGDTAGAAETYRRFSAKYPGTGQTLVLGALLDASRFDYDAAEATLRRARGRSDGPATQQMEILSDMGDIALARGRVGEARDLWRQARALMPLPAPDGPRLEALFEALTSAWLDVIKLDRGDRAAKTLDSALARVPLSEIDPVKRPYAELVGVYARAGRPDRARALLAERDRVVNQFPAEVRAAFSPGKEYDIQSTMGELALAQGRADDAIAAYRRAAGANGQMKHAVLPGLATAFERKGRPDSALAAYRAYLDTPALWRVKWDGTYLALVYERMADLYERGGDRSQAATYYGKLIDLYRNADPELRPVVQRARAGLARVTSEPMVGTSQSGPRRSS
ncbi:MAG: protein kinase domain-containing protein [Gemmatimonadota bacterium]